MARRLSKTTFQTGLQCDRALWLTFNGRQLKDPITPAQQALFDSGTGVGELAREMWPGGLLVEEDHTQPEEALATTARLLAGEPVTIFEAALTHGGVMVRPDVLVPNGDGTWDLFEVKSTARVKDQHITDAAVQAWVIEGAGLSLRRIHLTHLDTGYVHDGGAYALERLFSSDDVTEAVRAFMPHVPGLVAGMLGLIAEETEPDIPIGGRCDSPYTCAFYGHCHAFLPDKAVTKLSGIRGDVLDALIADGIHAIADVPPGYPGLTAKQRRVCELVAGGGGGRVVGDLARSLSALERPLYFLDFETVAAPLPLFARSRPYQQVPFQFSVHIVDGEGEPEHVEFLWDGDGDPRPALVDALIASLGESGSIVVYTSFEDRAIRGLAEAFPDRAAELEALRRRLFDLAKVVSAHVEHPDCLGSYSIKNVLPALVPDLSYSGLGIADGEAASRMYLESIRGELSEQQREQLFADLREYCGLDTLAMVRVYEVLDGGSL